MIPAVQPRAYPMQAAPPERREHGRSRKVYRLVRIGHGGDEGFARVRDISDTGMRLELSMPLIPDDRIEVAFSDAIVLDARVIWIHGKVAGVAFDRTVDSAALLAASAIETRAEDARPLRLRTALPATVQADGRQCRTLVQDMSLHDITIVHDGTFHPGLHVRLMLGGGREAGAVVRWTRDDFAELHLLDPFSVDELGSVRAF